MPKTSATASLILGAFLLNAAGFAQPIEIIDLATVPTSVSGLARIHGASGTGAYGVPVAGGRDLDGDGHEDSAVAFMTADPLSRTDAGEVDVIFGDGTIRGVIDTAVDQERVLRFYGAEARETAGAEIWIDDVTGDGLGDLLIGRQNATAAGKAGAGILTIVAGAPGLRTHSQTLQPVDLATPAPVGVTMTHLLGAEAGGRLGVWMRTGDVDGDGVVDLVVGSDQEALDPVADHHGSIYVLRGGPHLASGATYDLATLGAPGLNGKIARFAAEGVENHFGATCQIADLDGNGRSEVLAAATLNRAGASLQPLGGGAHGSGGVPHGRVDILWDDNFQGDKMGDWMPGFDVVLSAAPGTVTTIDGGADNSAFGEELLGGEDLDGDGTADLFVGDLVADFDFEANIGVGYVLFGGAALKVEPGFAIDDPLLPVGVTATMLIGPNAGALAGDTAAQGDFDGDGRADLAFCSPHAMPQGRLHAGAVHFLLGRDGSWPATIDVRAIPTPDVIEIIELQGALGSDAGNAGDTLCYSAAVGDLDANGIADLLVNEMRGDGTSVNDVGNLLHFSTNRLFQDGFETGDTSRWAS